MLASLVQRLKDDRTEHRRTMTEPASPSLTREAAWTLLTEFTSSPVLIRHALAVEAAMRGQASRLGGDIEYWGTVGLLHDFDFEQFPTVEQHPFEGARILRARGYPETLVEDILSHARYSGVARERPVQKALFAVWIHYCMCISSTIEITIRARTGGCAEKDEGQGFRAGSQPRGYFGRCA